MHITYYLGISAGAAVVFAAPSTKQDVGVSSASVDQLIRGITGDYIAADGTKYAAHRPEPFENDTALALVPAEAGTDANIQRRSGCEENRAIMIDHTDHFLDWDRQLSPIVVGPADIEIQSGQSISNTIEITGGAAGEKSFIAGDLGQQFQVNYSKTWSIDTRVHTKMTVKEGFQGVVVLNAATTRRYGRVVMGCLGQQKTITHFMADDHAEKIINKISFIEGRISVCQKSVNIPLTRCEGRGEFMQYPP